jgi:hypothetical protein
MKSVKVLKSAVFKNICSACNSFPSVLQNKQNARIHGD